MSAGARRGTLTVLVAALALGAAGFLIGRASLGGSAPPPGYLAQLAADLGLRPDQVAAADAILSEEDREIDALLGAALEPLRLAVAERRARTESALLALLDADQHARWQELSEAVTVHGGNASDADREDRR